MHTAFVLLQHYARFTLADPMPRLASSAVGGKSGRSHPTSRRDPIHIGRMARNAYIRVGWYGEGVLFITTPSERQLHCTRSTPDQPTTSRWCPGDAPTADSGSGPHSHWLSRQHRGTIGAQSGHNRDAGSANVKRVLHLSPCRPISFFASSFPVVASILSCHPIFPFPIARICCARVFVFTPSPREL